ncbi:MAG: hypothetical protein KBC83_03910 [Candidatus Moranbacteria bacterium]|nr:hypothetical protein [Candidatus Moranbacteria bacterium]MBP9801779.1 hypothetical protein [Candidatus Moranbacteria bacterium]
MNRSFKQKYGFFLFVVICITIGLTYWFGIRKTIEAIKEKRDEIQKMLVIRENRVYKLSKLEEYAAQYEQITNDEKWLDIFTTRDDMIEFVRRLESLAKESDVVIVLEARSIPKSQKSTKKVPEKTTVEKESAGKGTAETKEKEVKSIIEGLPSSIFTYLALHITGETEKVAQYLHKVEALPVALDIISIEALRKENPNFLSEENKQAISIQENNQVLSQTGLVPETNENPFVVLETIESNEESKTNFFEVEIIADLVVYHPKK